MRKDNFGRKASTGPPADFVDKTLAVNLNTLQETLEQLEKIGLITKKKGRYTPCSDVVKPELCILLDTLNAKLTKMSKSANTLQSKHKTVKTCKLPFRRLPVLR
jgi:DNA-binding transcriptional regulator YhcF (GntR family)